MSFLIACTDFLIQNQFTLFGNTPRTVDIVKVFFLTFLSIFRLNGRYTVCFQSVSINRLRNNLIHVVFINVATEATSLEYKHVVFR
jgi:hypothetical protein